jgi:antagonist of KipI
LADARVTIRVVTGGLQTTVQDLGRIGYQSEGVPVGGAMDRTALRLANLSVGNDEGAAVLEASLIGPALTFDSDAVVALAGADMEATIDGHAVPVWHAIGIRSGSTLRFGRPKTGCRTYVAVGGGISATPVFGSRSTYLRAKFGGHEGRSLKPGDVLETGTPSLTSRGIARALRTENGATNVARWSVATTVRPHYSDDVVARLVGGAHVNMLTAPSRDALGGATFRVSSSSDRMGYRLEGATLSLRQPLELLSEGVTFGTVQLPPGGAPIVLMADAQTTGGYPRVGEVASVDLPLIAQLKPGDRLRFRLISLEDAQALYLDHEGDIAQARAAIALQYARG